MPEGKSFELHFTASATVQDIVIGMADGLTVPFALAAGISGAVDSIHIIITAGLAEIAAGSIAMGLGGYLAARTAEEHYKSERERELYEIDNLNATEREETREIFRSFCMDEAQVEHMTDSMAKNKEKWADFMMRYELGLDKPEPKRAPISAMTIGGSYIVGGLIPLSSYMLISDIKDALIVSIIATLTALGVFGGIKGKLIGASALKAAFQTMFVGGLAAAVAYGIASYVSS